MKPFDVLPSSSSRRFRHPQDALPLLSPRVWQRHVDKWALFGKCVSLLQLVLVAGFAGYSLAGSIFSRNAEGHVGDTPLNYEGKVNTILTSKT